MNEEGFEAAASKSMVMVKAIMHRYPPQRVACDHPFVFIIRRIPTSWILFAGKFISP